MYCTYTILEVIEFIIRLPGLRAQTKALLQSKTKCEESCFMHLNDQ